jgi:hypothetical protein
MDRQIRKMPKVRQSAYSAYGWKGLLSSPYPVISVGWFFKESKFDEIDRIAGEDV